MRLFKPIDCHFHLSGKNEKTFLIFGLIAEILFKRYMSTTKKGVCNTPLHTLSNLHNLKFNAQLTDTTPFQHLAQSQFNAQW